MRTTLPTSRRPSQAGRGRAAAATVLAVALGVGASLCPADIQGLIGLSPAERSTQHLDVFTPSGYAAPKRADVTLLRASDLAGLAAGGGAPTLQTELLELARTHGSPELVGTLEMVRFIQENLQGHQLVRGGGGGGGGGQAPLSGDAFLELVALMENLLQSIAGASGTELAGLISNVLPEVMRRWEILVFPTVPAEEGAVAAQDVPPAAPQTPEAPPPAPQPVAPFTTAPAPTYAEPTSEPPAPAPPPSPESPAPTTQQLPAPSPAPDVIEVEDPPSIEETPEPVATAEPQPEPEPEGDDPGSSTEPTDAEPEDADQPSSSDDDASVSNSDNSSHEQDTSAGNDASNG